MKSKQKPYPSIVFLSILYNKSIQYNSLFTTAQRCQSLNDGFTAFVRHSDLHLNQLNSLFTTAQHHLSLNVCFPAFVRHDNFNLNQEILQVFVVCLWYRNQQQHCRNSFNCFANSVLLCTVNVVHFTPILITIKSPC